MNAARGMAVLLLAASAAAHAQQVTPVCTIDALAPREYDRYITLTRELTTTAPVATRELRGGFEFDYRPDPVLLARVGEWMGYERRACGSYTLELTVRPGAGPVTLRWSGPDEVARDVIQAAIDIAKGQ